MSRSVARSEIEFGGSRSLYRRTHRSCNRRTRPARPFSRERDYGRLPSGAPQSGQVLLLARPDELPSPVTPKPARTTKPNAAVLLTPRWSASSPSCCHRASSSLTWVSCRSVGILGRAIIGKCKGTTLTYDYPSTSRYGTLRG